MVSRRDFFKGAGAVAISAGLVSRVGAASLPEAPLMDNATTQQPLMPPNGHPLQPGSHAERLVAALAHE